MYHLILQKMSYELASREFMEDTSGQSGKSGKSAIVNYTSRDFLLRTGPFVRPPPISEQSFHSN